MKQLTDSSTASTDSLALSINPSTACGVVKECAIISAVHTMMPRQDRGLGGIAYSLLQLAAYASTHNLQPVSSVVSACVSNCLTKSLTC